MFILDENLILVKVDKANLSAKFDQTNNFTYTKNKINEKKVTTIFSDIAKPFVKKFKFIKGFENGKLDYTSTEVNKNLSISELRIYNFKIQIRINLFFRGIHHTWCSCGSKI